MNFIFLTFPHFMTFDVVYTAMGWLEVKNIDGVEFLVTSDTKMKVNLILDHPPTLWGWSD